ncbi:hypothetical protein V5O48_010131 [Marasmius crinis-equi]|uniref:Uncharacterized protein n=1 Tax=Marasmius crinis-equi TaxID=585013 RepID=A0ABR3F9A1_9AGAR
MSIRSLFLLCAIALTRACSPDFAGVGVFIKDGNGQFLLPEGPGLPNPPRWYVQQDGQASQGYILSDFNNANSVLTRNADNTVTMSPASASGIIP